MMFHYIMDMHDTYFIALLSDGSMCFIVYSTFPITFYLTYFENITTHMHRDHSIQNATKV